MLIEYENFNGADQVVQGQHAEEWGDVERVLSEMPLNLQPSQESGMVGDPIFDPKETNRYIERGLSSVGWDGIRIPSSIRSFGRGVDFGKSGVLIEAQFSNYPYLSNNLLRADLLNKDQVTLDYKKMDLSVR